MTSMDNHFLVNYFLNNRDAGIHKWLDYFDIYDRFFSSYRGKKIKFLEIGVQNGGSAKMWRQYFGENVSIIGVDIDPACKNLEFEGFEVWIGDQANPEFWKSLLQEHPTFDIILDDGGHTMEQQLISFYSVFPCLSNGGVYLCEDTHSSYFPKCGGGIGEKSTFLEHMKSLIDGMHAWYFSPLTHLPKEYWANNLYALSFFDSIVVAEKRLKNPPVALARGYGHVQNPTAMTFVDVRRAFGITDE